ncbi:MAG: hypothetical protein IPN53_08795 [Comamonadaceae bacterium]|nr:hypothetical protein [Comamonadaceae bacterium]
MPFPKPTPEATVDSLARRILKVLEFVGADQHAGRDRVRMELSAQAQWRYSQLYRSELNGDVGSDLVNAMLERRAPMLLRLAMMCALTDLRLKVDIAHIEAAMAWIRYATASVRYVFVSAADKPRWHSRSIWPTGFWLLQGTRWATRSEISTDCFKGRITKAQIDACLDHLLTATPPKICVQVIQRSVDAPGSQTRIYRLV